MPAAAKKPSAAAAAPAAPAAPTGPPPPPPDLGPCIHKHLPALKEVFSLFDPENSTFMLTSDVLPLLHSLGVHCSPTEFQAEILPHLGSMGEPPRVPYDALEAKVLALLDTRAFPGPSASELRAAFGTMDKEKTGEVTVDSLRKALTNPSTPDALSVDEFQTFLAQLPKVTVPEGDPAKVSYASYARALGR